MGFNRNALSQIDVNNMSEDDTRQVILLGLAADNMDHQDALAQL